MTAEDWRARLRATPPSGWPALLDAHSDLPGPRANLTLVDAVAFEADDATIDVLLAGDDEFRTMCAAAALARHADDAGHEARARTLASDAR